MRRNDENRPPTKETGPANTTNQGQRISGQRQAPASFLVGGSSPVATVLDRLDGVRRSPRGWTARCPAHEDRHQSLSVGEGRDGRALVNCFAGCTAEDVTRALSLELKDLFEQRDERPPLPRRSRPKPAVLPRSIAASLLETGEFCLMFEVAKLLAPLPPRLMHQDIASAWGVLERSGIDVPALVKLASLLRGIAFFCYCDARHVEDADVARAVRRLVDELEARAA